MLSREGNENSQKKSVGLISTCSTLFGIFLCCCFALLQHKTSRNFLVFTFDGGNVVCVPLPFFSLPLTFTLVAASTSHFLTAAINFRVILPTNRNWSPLFFIFCPSSFFVIYINVDIKIKLKERISFVVAFLPLKARVATQFIAKTSGT